MRSLRLPDACGRALRLAFLPVLGLAFVLAGCSDRTDSPTASQGSELVLDGAQVPEVVFEGESTSLLAWGTYPGESGSFEGLDVDVLSTPDDEHPGRIRVRARASDPGENGPQRGEPFQGTVQLPSLAPGDYVVELVRPGWVEERNLVVFPRSGWVLYRAFGDPILADEGLVIRRDGYAMAFREGEGRPGRTTLDSEAMDTIRQWFRQAHFSELRDAYISDAPEPMRHYDVTFAEGNVAKRVRADEPVMPDELRTLAGQLSGLIDRILANRPQDLKMTGQLTVEPVIGEPGSARKITLTLVNEGSQPVTLHSATSQLFDIVLIRPPAPGTASPDAAGNLPPDPGPNDGPTLLLWNWAHDQVFVPEATELVVDAGAAKVFDVSWDGQTNDGRVVPAGIYEVRGMTTTVPGVRIRPARLAVRGEMPGGRLAATLSVTPAEAPPGTPRQLTLAVTNLGDAPVDVEYPTAQEYDFAIDDPLRAGAGPMGPSGPLPLWIWSHDKEFPQVVQTLTWQPGETRRYSETWDGSTMRGEVLGPGLYTLSGWGTGKPGVAARPISFLVTRR
jgi:hypothetical protein